MLGILVSQYSVLINVYFYYETPATQAATQSVRMQCDAIPPKKSYNPGQCVAYCLYSIRLLQALADPRLVGMSAVSTIPDALYHLCSWWFSKIR